MKCLLILTWFLSHNYSHNEALGIVANLWVESRCDPNANNGSQIGIAQWQGNRKQNLILFVKRINHHWSYLNTQLEFLHHEWRQLHHNQNLLTPQEFAIRFCNLFEKPRFSCKSRGNLTKTQPWRNQ